MSMSKNPTDGDNTAMPAAKPQIAKSNRAAPKQDAPIISLDSKRPFEFADHPELAERLLAIVAPKVKAVFDEGELYTYDSPIWTARTEPELSCVVQSFSGAPKGEDNSVKIKIGDVYGAIKCAQHQVDNIGFFSKAPAGIAFRNGFVRIDTDGIHLDPHASDNRARFAYNFDFDEHACPIEFLRCLNDVFRDDDDKQQKISCLQEFAGASLCGVAPRYAKAFALVGEGDNGKSTVLECIQAAFPQDSRTAIPPQLWHDEYHRAKLAGKRLNVVNEMPQGDIIGAEDFKVIITGELTHARQIRQAVFDFRAAAGHIFALNNLIGTTDQSHAFWRRWLVLTFNRTFAESEKIPDYGKLLVAKELPAIVSWMLHGTTRLIQQGRYTTPTSHQEALENWRRKSDSVRLFIDEQTRPLADYEPVANGTTPKDLYQKFKTWCADNGHKGMSSVRFAERVERVIGKWTRPHDGPRVYRIRFVYGDES